MTTWLSRRFRRTTSLPRGSSTSWRAANTTSSQAACMCAGLESGHHQPMGPKQQRCQGGLCNRRSSLVPSKHAIGHTGCKLMMLASAKVQDHPCSRDKWHPKHALSGHAWDPYLYAIGKEHRATRQGIRKTVVWLPAQRAGAPGRAAGPPSTCRPPSRRSARSAAHPAHFLDQGLIID